MSPFFFSIVVIKAGEKMFFCLCARFMFGGLVLDAATAQAHN